MTPYLINAQSVKDLGLIHLNVEDSVLKVIIQRVQLSVVEPAIGEKLYDRLLEGIEVNNLTADEELLIDKYITPMLVAACDKKAVIAYNWEIRNKGAGTTNDQYFQSSGVGEHLVLSDDINIDVQVAKRKLFKFLRNNRDKYPLWDESCDCNKNGATGYNLPTISFR